MDSPNAAGFPDVVGGRVVIRWMCDVSDKTFADACKSKPELAIFAEKFTGGYVALLIFCTIITVGLFWFCMLAYVLVQRDRKDTLLGMLWLALQPPKQRKVAASELHGQITGTAAPIQKNADGVAADSTALPFGAKAPSKQLPPPTNPTGSTSQLPPQSTGANPPITIESLHRGCLTYCCINYDRLLLERDIRGKHPEVFVNGDLSRTPVSHKRIELSGENIGAWQDRGNLAIKDLEKFKVSGKDIRSAAATILEEIEDVFNASGKLGDDAIEYARQLIDVHRFVLSGEDSYGAGIGMVTYSFYDGRRSKVVDILCNCDVKKPWKECWDAVTAVAFGEPIFEMKQSDADGFPSTFGPSSSTFGPPQPTSEMPQSGKDDEAT
ncbi:MAG: hypothetical protein LBB38_04090 [Puniceicoccales bacterium]|jgi:hypothetical protein|nr:hypothetical protein [Puniceicoccales bacterium]